MIYVPCKLNKLVEEIFNLKPRNMLETCGSMPLSYNHAVICHGL